MKLLVNVSSLAPPLTGIGHSTKQLLIQLLMNPDISVGIQDIKGFDVFGVYDRDELISWLEKGKKEDKADNYSADTNVKKMRLLRSVLSFLKPYIKKIPYARALKNVLMRRKSEQVLERYNDYIYWEPNYVMQEFSGKSLATIHDLSHVYYPEYHPRERIEELNSGLDITLNHADRLIAVSEFTRLQILDCWQPSQPVDIVSPAVDESFYNVDVQKQAEVKEKYSLPSDYILSVATMEPRKNFVGLLKAYASLSDEIRKRFPLLLVGSRGWLTDETESVLASLVKSGEVRYLGYIAQEDMPALYQGATLMPYVSFYEGYGMPIAEAMAAGTAVVTSDCSSMPEVAGGCAELVDPTNIESIRDGLHRMLTDDELRQQKAEAGHRRAQEWSWEASAKCLLTSMAAISS